MKFRIEFEVDEADLGGVMAQLYRSMRIENLDMSPVVEDVALPPPPTVTVVDKKPEALSKSKYKASGGLREKIHAAMEKGMSLGVDFRNLATAEGYAPEGVCSCLDRMVKAGEIHRAAPGVYTLGRTP
jgi:hypothetical protein